MLFQRNKPGWLYIALHGELVDFAETHLDEEARVLARLGVERTQAAAAADLRRLAAARRVVGEYSMGG